MTGPSNTNNKPPIEPHDYQLEGICKVLDGVNVLATMATGSGKTGFYFFLMIAVLALSESKSCHIENEAIPDNPCMLLISPIKALEQDMVNDAVVSLAPPDNVVFQAKNISGFGLNVLVINSDTCAAIWEQKQDLWIDAREGPNIIILSSEELQNNHFSHLLNNFAFSY